MSGLYLGTLWWAAWGCTSANHFRGCSSFKSMVLGGKHVEAPENLWLNLTQKPSKERSARPNHNAPASIWPTAVIAGKARAHRCFLALPYQPAKGTLKHVLPKSTWSRTKIARLEQSPWHGSREVHSADCANLRTCSQDATSMKPQ